jgi:excisionase family DNA binding protein
MSDRLLSVRDVAARLGVSPSLVYALVSAGRIRHERHGMGRGVIRVTPEAVEEYRLSVTRGAVSPPASGAECRPSGRGRSPSPFSELDPARLARAWAKPR